MESNVYFNHQPSKLTRKPVNPIQFINNQDYRDRQRGRQIKVDFQYVKPKLEKGWSKKKEATPNKIVQKSEFSTLDRSGILRTQQESMLRVTSESSFDKFQVRRFGESTEDGDFLKSLDADTDILKNDIYLHDQLHKARKQIFRMEQQLQTKNKKISQQGQIIKNQQILLEIAANKQTKLNNQVQKLSIKVSMILRRNQENFNYIRKLRTINKQKIMGKNNTHQKQQDYGSQFYILSPEKCQFNDETNFV